jgi:hypothetical protein
MSLISVTLWANQIHWNRGVHERAYFNSIAMSLLFPEDLVEDESGLTQLRLSKEDSLRAAAFLKNHRLSVYRNPAQVISDATNTAGTGGVVWVSGGYSDGWLGPQARAVITQDKCESVLLSLTPFQIEESSRDGLISFTVSDALNSSALEGRALSEPFNGIVVLDLDRPVKTFKISFSQSWNPSALGISADSRNLSAQASARCID